MGLDIELYYCDNWANVLLNRDKLNDFAKSLDWKTLNPDWYNTVGVKLLEDSQDEFNLHVLDDSENEYIFHRELLRFAHENNIPIMMDRIGGENCAELAPQECLVYDKDNNPMKFRMCYNSENLDHMLKHHGLPQIYRILDIQKESDQLYFNINWIESITRLTEIMAYLKTIQLDSPFDTKYNMYQEQLRSLRNILEFVCDNYTDVNKYRLLYSD